MDMEMKFENGVYMVAGRINSRTAEQFKEGLADAFGTASVTLDFKDVEYISSAGLRVLMALRHGGSDVKVVNVSRAVCDVFETTGFSTFIRVERPVREISVENLPCIGAGATGAAYRLDEERIVKLFYDRIGEARVAAELATAKEAFVMGVPSCIPFELVRAGSRYGIIYELIRSSTLNELLACADAEEEERLVRKYVGLMKMASAIHYGADPKGMDIKKAMVGAAARLKNVFFNEEEYQEALKLFLNMKEGSNFVHGDAHPGNVMVEEGELIYIDMTTSGYGDPFWDLVAVASECYVNTVICSDEEYEKRYVMTRERARDVFYKTFEVYYEGESEERITRLEQLAIGTASFRALMGQLYNPNRNPVVIGKMKELALDAAALLDEPEMPASAA